MHINAGVKSRMDQATLIGMPPKAPKWSGTIELISASPQDALMPRRHVFK